MAATRKECVWFPGAEMRYRSAATIPVGTHYSMMPGHGTPRAGVAFGS
ncbi:MAG: hypothetical protein AB8A46_07035 [Prochlorococcus sp.]|nr:hypothetical protein [Prochlorococcus sp.]MDP6192733.1 hypothetical protein [Prochlorococcaceae cyanobacterium ETNP18_MAG_1]